MLLTSTLIGSVSVSTGGSVTEGGVEELSSWTSVMISNLSSVTSLLKHYELMWQNYNIRSLSDTQFLFLMFVAAMAS